jgi:hypothetical protein
MHCWVQAEADRFVTRPFLMESHEGVFAHSNTPSRLEQPARTVRAQAATSLEQRKTTSIFSPAQ